MYRGILIILLCMWVNVCLAGDFTQHTTTYNPTPGTYRIEFGGLWKVAHQEASRYAERSWRDQEWERYNEGAITWSELSRRQGDITLSLSEWSGGPPWYYRRWWESREPSSGGAAEHPTIIKYGTTRVLFDNVIFSLTNEGNFTLRGFQAALSRRSVDYGVDVPAPKTGWKIKFSPDVSVSASQILSDPSQIIKRIGCRISLVYLERALPLIALDIGARWRFNRHEGVLEFRARLLQW